MSARITRYLPPTLDETLEEAEKLMVSESDLSNLKATMNSVLIDVYGWKNRIKELEERVASLEAARKNE